MAQPFTPRNRLLDMGPLSANLIRYPAGHGMKPHTDGCRRLSVVVFGDLAEGDRRTVEAGAVGSVGLKAPDFVHETRFGPAGACIVSAILPDPLVRRVGSSPESLVAWRWVHDGAASLAGLRLASALWRRDGDVAEAALTTLLAGFLDDRRSEVPPSVPLAGVRERLHDVGERPNVKGLTRQVGMHPGALNRAFRRAFGCSLTRVSSTGSCERCRPRAHSIRRRAGAGRAPIRIRRSEPHDARLRTGAERVAGRVPCGDAGRSWVRIVQEWGTVEITAESGELVVRAGRLHCVATAYEKPETMRVELVPGTGQIAAFAPEDGAVETVSIGGDVYARVK
jgi:hypothetical protein